MQNEKHIIYAVGPDFSRTPTAFRELFEAYYNSLFVLMDNGLHNSTEMIVKSLFLDKFKDTVIQCILDINESFAKLFNAPDFYQKVQDAMAAELYTALRKD